MVCRYKNLLILAFVSVISSSLTSSFVSCTPGWMMGERLHDGESGWFPSRVVEEIQSKEVRAQNLREALRIQQAHEGGSHTGARIGGRTGRHAPKGSSVSKSWTDQMKGSNELKWLIGNSDVTLFSDNYILCLWSSQQWTVLEVLNHCAKRRK